MRKFVIDIYKLSSKVHHYEFDIDDTFFSHFEQDLVDAGSLIAKIELEKNDSFLVMEVKITGTVQLICDRSLDKFQYPLDEMRRVIFKYGDEEQELDHDVVMITSETQQINVGQYIFEFVGLAVPMKKLHPRFTESDEEFGALVYQSNKSQDSVLETDPRWSKLNELKKNQKI
ncbi:MAG: DNA-binding protein [Cyclobacteriaceae bacterium]|nr:MAG: DNA-binding protein [Cyclobacteriaceae bacterium]